MLPAGLFTGGAEIRDRHIPSPTVLLSARHLNATLVSACAARERLGVAIADERRLAPAAEEAAFLEQTAGTAAGQGPVKGNESASGSFGDGEEPAVGPGSRTSAAS
jgi:hypothetical protein